MKVLHKFIQFEQNYLFSPIINKDLGMNKRVFVEVEKNYDEHIDDVEEKAKTILENLGYDLDEWTTIDAFSDTQYRVWDLFGYVDIFEVMEYGKDYSLILLDGTIKNF
jgi:hypothetical protein